jgi:hypothetical protein
VTGQALSRAAGATNNEYPEGKMTKAGNFILSTNEGKAIGGRSF